MSVTRYDTIGKQYSRYRQPDARITSQIKNILSLPKNSLIADVGAGTGNYALALAEDGYRIKAIEPSSIMREQAEPHELIEWLVGSAECLPLPDSSVDGLICILAAHHFTSLQQAVSEMIRVCPEGPIVFFTFDPRLQPEFWFRDYFPSIWDEAYKYFPALSVVANKLTEATSKDVEIIEFALPHDLKDNFAASGWRNPEIYLNLEIRSSMSAFALSNQEQIKKSVDRLQVDLQNGTWQVKYGFLRSLSVYDVGYRFLLL